MTTAENKTLIALDYDGTATVDIPFWVNFIENAKKADIEVVIVTMRYPHEKVDMDSRLLDACHWVVMTERRAKREYCALFEIYPDIWIDDMPEFILHDAGDVKDDEAIEKLEEEIEDSKDDDET